MADAAITSPLTSEAVQSLRDQVRGRVLGAADEGYDEARMVHNGMFDRRPLAILKAEQVGDVIGGVNFARDNGLDLSVRGGGHSGPGFGTNDGGLVIDMPARHGVTSTTQLTRSVWRPPAESSRPRASPASHWEEASAISPAGLG
jgi:FAD/FMN-containing dehydrogenase